MTEVASGRLGGPADRSAPANSYPTSLQDLPAAAIAGLANAGSIQSWLRTASPAEREKFLNQPVVRPNVTTGGLLDAPSSSLSSLVECITYNQELLSAEIAPELPLPYNNGTEVTGGSRGGVIASNASGAERKPDVRVSKKSPSAVPYPCFPSHNLHDFKHVLYNLTAEAHNDTSGSTFLQPVTMEEGGRTRNGFRFNKNHMPEKKLPELYAQHIRKSRLDQQDQSSVFIQDLYKFYLRACVELLSKYFEKRDKWTYLYDEVPLFVPGETLDDAQNRLKGLQTRARKRSKKGDK